MFVLQSGIRILAQFFAMIPLASILSFASEELLAKLGPKFGSLMEETFGNVVEIIVSSTKSLKVLYRLQQRSHNS